MDDLKAGFQLERFAEERRRDAMEKEGMRDEEFEAIKARVQAAIAADGSIKATMAGQNYLGHVGRDIVALIAEVERLRG